MVAIKISQMAEIPDLMAVVELIKLAFGGNDCI